MMHLGLIAQLTFAGAVVGYLIGPESLDQFIGMFPENTVLANVLVGALIGAGLGVIGSFAKEID
ncbi:hypothetical protein [Roseitalea sp. MMSF_3504]|nr:hypothetical protein [Roseitalea sp. MMSF_3504]